MRLFNHIEQQSLKLRGGSYCVNWECMLLFLLSWDTSLVFRVNRNSPCNGLHMKDGFEQIWNINALFLSSIVYTPNLLPCYKSGGKDIYVYKTYMVKSLDEYNTQEETYKKCHTYLMQNQASLRN